MQLVEREDLMFGKRGAAARAGASLLMGLLGIGKINRLYADTLAAGDRCAEELLRQLGVTVSVCDHDRANIPAEGPVIFISNHPTGLLDGIMLIDLLSKIRPDVRFMGNFLLERIESLNRYFIPVDPFDSKDAGKNLRGLRESLAHLKRGGALVLFPAGEVATWQKGFSTVRDKPWSPSAVRFIRRANVPVVPVCIEGRNSRLFHLAGKIHPLLRTALLPHELVNKRGITVDINIGSALTPRRLAELGETRAYGDYLRANVDYLRKKKPRRKIRILPRRKPVRPEADEIVSPAAMETLTAELRSIRADHLLFAYNNYETYFAPPEAIPLMMHEIGRMREVTFREVGEGSMKSIDTDRYDAYYHQLFVWDTAEKALVGAYRLGLGDRIVPRFGLDGFYTNSLFRMSPQMEPIMARTIELGRSFIAHDYQRRAASLMLLWKGILYVLLKHEQYRNLLGPVTISGEFERVSKTLIVRYLQKKHMNRKLAPFIRPVTGLEGIDFPLDDSLIDGVENIDLINKIVCDIERDEMAIPILIRKYLQLNSHVLAFNVDHDFCDALDALMLLDLKKVPENIIQMLSKEITDIDVIARFRRFDNR